MKILGIGSVIEFKDKRLNGKFGCEEDLYVDRVTTIMLHSGGEASYWTAIYPELYGVEPDIEQDRIVRCIEEIKFVPPKKKANYPAGVGDLISFQWDDGREGGIVTDIYTVIDNILNAPWRMLVKKQFSDIQFHLCEDELEDYKLKIEKGK